MAGWDAVSGLMDEVAGGWAAGTVTELPVEGAWYVAVPGGGDGPALVLAYDPEADRLLFRAGLGRPDPALREATYAALLAYNGQALATGGGCVGIDRPGGEAVLRYEAPADGLDADTLRGLLLDLLAAAEGWRAYVGREPSAAAGGEAPGQAPGQAPIDLDLLRYHAIRG